MSNIEAYPKSYWLGQADLYEHEARSLTKRLENYSHVDFYLVSNLAQQKQLLAEQLRTIWKDPVETKCDAPSPFETGFSCQLVKDHMANVHSGPDTESQSWNTWPVKT